MSSELLQTLEAFRLEHRLSKTALSKLLGVTPQMLNNWFMRDSIPKSQQAGIMELLANPEKIASIDDQIMAGLSELSASEKQMISELISKISRK